MTAFTRGFRLHLADGQVLDGAAFPSGRTIVVDDPEYGLATVTTSLEVLLQGYHGARVEWDDEALLDGQPRPTADSITSDQLDALLLKAARMQHAVQQYAEATVRLDEAKTDVLEADTDLPGVTDQQRRKLATTREIAEYCGVPIGTVYQWSSRGGGPKFIKVGRHLRARWSDVERWLDASMTPPSTVQRDGDQS